MPTPFVTAHDAPHWYPRGEGEVKFARSFESQLRCGNNQLLANALVWRHLSSVRRASAYTLRAAE
jgi:hypothetical protein